MHTRKIEIYPVLLAAVAGLLLALAGTADASDWNQYGHDAARTSQSPVHGPQWPRVAPGWPVDCTEYGVICNAGVATAVLNRFPEQRRPSVFVGANSFTNTAVVGSMYGFDSDGRPLPNWPAHLASPGDSGEIVSYPAVATASGEDHIYATNMNGTIFGIGSDTRTLPGRWPQSLPGYQSWNWPAVKENDRTRAETLYTTHGASSWEPDQPLMHALGADGSERSGFPIRIGWTLFMQGPVVARDETIYVLDYVWEGFQDDSPSGYRSYLRAFTPDGRAKPGWPFRLPHGLQAWFGFEGPAVGADGTVYVGVPYAWEFVSLTARSLYYAFAPDGSVKLGFPVDLRGNVLATPAIAPDGTTYVATWQKTASDRQEASVYAFTEHGDVKPGWPLTFAAPYAGPSDGTVDLLDDTNKILGLAVDRDGNIYFASQDTVYAYSPAARSLPGWPFRVQDVGGLAFPVLASDGTLYLTSLVNGSPEDPLSFDWRSKVFALRSGKPRRCDPRWSDRRCPPTKVEGGVLRQIDAP